MIIKTSKGGIGCWLCRVLDRRKDQACAKACAEAYLSDDCGQLVRTGEAACAKQCYPRVINVLTRSDYGSDGVRG